MNVRFLWTLPLAATATILAPGAAAASSEAPVTITDGAVVERDYAPLVGANDDDASLQVYANNYLAGCRRVGPCDIIPIELDHLATQRRADTLVKLTVTYDNQAGTDRLSTWLFDPAREGPSDVPLQRGPNVPTGHIDFYIPDPTLTRYDFVVNNVQGANTGFHLRATVVTVPRPMPPSGVTASSPAAAHATTVVRTTQAPAEAAAAQASDRLGLSPASELVRPRDLAGHASDPMGLRHLPWWLVVLAGSLLLVVGVRWKRAVDATRGRPVPALRRRLRDLPLFWKVLTPFVAVMILVGLAGTYITARYMTNQAQSSLDESLLQRSAAAEAFLRDQELYELEAVEYAANLVGVPQTVAAGDRAATARSLASAIAVHKELDVLSVVNRSGNSIVDYTRSGARFVPHGGADWSHVRAVKQVLAGFIDAAGDKHTGLVRLADGQNLLVVVAPVRTTHVVGAVIAGIDADRLATGIASRGGDAVAIYGLSSEQIGASTGSLPTTIPPSWVSQTLRHRWAHGGKQLASIYAPLVVRGLRIGSVGVTRPVGSAFAHVRGAALQLAVLALLALAVIGVLGLAITRYILSMVRPLLAANRSFGRGDLGIRAEVRSEDELGELASGFNQMADRLQASYEELERRVAQRTEELQRLYDETAADSEARAQFFAMVSHELRTPLFAILANAELLTDPVMRPETPAEVEEFTTTIVQSSRVLLDRVNELLDFARLDAGAQMHLDLAPVRPSDAWEDVAPSMTALARTQGVSLDVDLPATLPPVTADPTRLRQVLLNLVSNALKYSVRNGQVRVSATVAGDELEFVVADHGIGIPADVGDKIFEPYYQVQRRDQHSNLPSTGLGLAITKRIVDAHGGRIRFDSAEGVGTTFRLSLPIARRDDAIPSARAAAAKGRVSS